MNVWKHKKWETFKGTWAIFTFASDSEIISWIKDNPQKYGNLEDWEKKEVGK